MILPNRRDIRSPARPHALRPLLADRGAAAHADEQPGCRGRRAPGGSGGLRRHRPRRARLGQLRPHRRHPAPPRTTTRPCWCSPASRSACSSTHPDAPRVLIANSNLVGALGHLGPLSTSSIAPADDVRPDDRRLLDLHRQPGHRAGHLRDLRGSRAPAITAASPPAAGSSPAASAAWAARSRWPPPWPASAAWPSNARPRRIEMRLRTGYLDREAPDLDAAMAMLEAARDAGTPVSIGLRGNAAEVFDADRRRRRQPACPDRTWSPTRPAPTTR